MRATLRSIKKPDFWSFLVGAALVGLLALGIFVFVEKDLKIDLYKQYDDLMEFEFNVDIEEYCIKRFGHVPLKISLIELREGAECFDLNHHKLLIHLNHEVENQEYSIFVLFSHGYFEVVRQSETWLLKKFNFKRSGGYSILGRHTLGLAG
ncbi:hypothetical protein [Marinobacterium sp. xm-d-530]|uniref:hypothetical protein n=1 Tax=Marinobacterium sp. xm-d-530 TaxID=2497747 RepID=UPI001568014C|nr:hypothetical protein [Marinobacterium sp. xm-d-530]NRQ01183.1 hypothetical protein [Marinobacterium sp. xm-d-530]